MHAASYAGLAVRNVRQNAVIPASLGENPTTGFKKYETATVKRFQRSIARVHPLMKR
jgi:hypothetical protein